MSRLRRAARAARADRGAVMVTVAMLMPIMIGFTGLVVDVGNWFAHKRHLQTQADAGALAGAGKFRFPCDTGVNDAILAEVAKYSSVDSLDEGYNPQIGTTPAAELHREMNSPTWYDQETPVDDSVRTGLPCAAKMIDVKLTETNLPWYLKIFQSVPYINTHARVEIRKQTISSGALPVGVPEVGPRKAKALFVNESTGSVIASTDLVRTGNSGGLAIWSNVAAPVPVTVNTAHIGVRIVLSGSNSTTCGDTLVTCFGAGTNTAIVANTAGLSHIRGYDATSTASVTSPQLRSVALSSSGCEDSYFTALPTTPYPCTVNPNAVVDFGGGPIAAIRVLARRTGANANTTVELTPPATSGGAWTGPPGVSIAGASGANGIDIMWQTGCNTDRTKPCNSTKNVLGAATAQRTFAANESLDVSGPIKLLRISEDSVPGANSFPMCATCSHNLVVTLGLKPALENAQSSDEDPISLKVAGGGSQNQGLDCDPDQPNIRDELENGCQPQYAENDGVACPANSTSLWGSAQPWKCVVINTGATVGQVTQGMNLRILGDANPSSCTAPNNWADFPEFPDGDPRIVQVFLAPFGAFTGSGGAVVPVTGFATFYVTGWDGGACQGAGDDTAGQGAIVGHFIKYIDKLGTGGGEEVCDENALGSCVAVFTR